MTIKGGSGLVHLHPFFNLKSMNQAAELVSGSLLGESMATIIIGRKVYTVNPPAIKVICRACSAFAKIRLEGDYTKLSVIGEIPCNAPHIIKGLSALIVGDVKHWRWKAYKVSRYLQSATNKELNEAWETIYPLIGGEDFFAYAFSMKNAVKMIAKEKL